jgi:hypothetical protein
MKGKDKFREQHSFENIRDVRDAVEPSSLTQIIRQVNPSYKRSQDLTAHAVFFGRLKTKEWTKTLQAQNFSRVKGKIF